LPPLLCLFLFLILSSLLPPSLCMQLKRNQWGIPIGIVQNRVDVYTKRAASAKGDAPPSESTYIPHRPITFL
jgi:hypothetical protein